MRAATALKIMIISGLVSFASAQVCDFPGGRLVKDAKFLDLNSYSDDDTAKVYISDATVKCAGDISGYDIYVNRNTALASHSTIVLPVAFTMEKNDCFKLYDIFNFTTDNDGKWYAEAHVISDVSANRPVLLMNDTENKKCQEISWLEFKAKGQLTASQHAIASVWLFNQKTGGNDWSFEGVYNFTRWEAGDADLGKVYGYAAKDKGKVTSGQFVKVGSGAFVPPLRAYLKYRGNNKLAKSANEEAVELPEKIEVRLIDGDGELTGIVRMNTATGEITKVNGWYDLKGRKLNKKPENKGMFVGTKAIQK